MGIYFIDESGYHGNFIFAAVKVEDHKTPKAIIKKWRRWRRNAKINYEINEYHDTDVTDKERKKMINLISKVKEIKAWGIQKNNYTGTMKGHIASVIALLKYIDIKESDVVIIDNPGVKDKMKERYIRQARKELKMKSLVIYLEDSEKEKGIQVVDAIAGSLSRNFIPRDGKESYFELISFMIEKEVIKT